MFSDIFEPTNRNNFYEIIYINTYTGEMKYSDKVTSSWLCPIKGLYFPKWNSKLFKLICYQNSDGQPMILTNESIKLTRVTEPYR